MKGKPSYFRSTLQSVIALLFLVTATPSFAAYFADNAAIISALASGELIPKTKLKGGSAPNAETQSASTMSSGSSYTGDSTAIVPDLFTGSFTTEVPIRGNPNIHAKSAKNTFVAFTTS